MASGVGARELGDRGDRLGVAKGVPAAGRSAHWSGARADFVASLGRKVADAKALLSHMALEGDGDPRDELRRRFDALRAAARMLHFDAMALRLEQAIARLEKSQDAIDPARLTDVLDGLSSLTTQEAPEPSAGEAALAAPAASALIVGGEAIADALTENDEGLSFECERTGHSAGGLGLARALAPDVVIVDGDLSGSLDLVEALLDDRLTESIPILVLGDFRTPEVASRFVALGAAKTLAKPVSPSALQRACQDVVDHRAGRTTRVVLGEPTVEQLGERLAEELRRALVDAVDGTGRRARVMLGDGTEVLGALWGAIARVRAVVTMRSDGAVRYPADGPEGAIAVAPWLHPEVAGADRAPHRGRGAGADVALEGRVVVVADDDPGVTWFIADVLRSAGCVVHEALDGTTAFKLACEHSAELVVTDILMPGLDGLALCRALKRDVALRDVPVVLLSWKEDLLQRVRELGIGAAASVRKESDASAILARVREVLRPKARTEARLKVDGEVCGRLDGLGVRALLELVCRMRPDARLAIRDASFLYEVEIRGGTPRRATRTASDGSYCRGDRVLASMLGVGAGRFVVTPSASAVGFDLKGTLDEQIARPVRLAREAITPLTGARLASVDRVVLDEDTVAGYLLATPGPVRDLVERIAGGVSPRDLLLGGDIPPALLEDVLADLAGRGAVLKIVGVTGQDLLDPAVDRRLGSKRVPAVTGTSVTPTPVAEAVPVERTSSVVLKARPSLEDVLVDAIRDRPVSEDSPRPLAMVEAVEASPAAEPLTEARESDADVVAPAVGSGPSLLVSVTEGAPQRVDVTPAAAALSNTAPSRERLRKAAAAARGTEEETPAAPPMKFAGGRGWLAALFVLAFAAVMATYSCGSRTTPAEPDPSTHTP